MEFSIASSPILDGAACAIAVDGDLDHESWMGLRPAVEDVIVDRQALILDLAECRAVDETAAGVVLRIYRDLCSGDPAVPMGLVVDASAFEGAACEALDLTVPMFPTRELALAWLAEVTSEAPEPAILAAA